MKRDSAEPETTRPSIRKRRARLKAEQLREKLLTTALEVLDRDGLTLTLAHLNVEGLIRATGIPRSSYYRAWPSNELLYLDLIAAMVAPERMDERVPDPGTTALGYTIIKQYEDRMGDRDGRRAVLRELIRQTVAYNFDSTHESLAWRTHAALTAPLSSLSAENHSRAKEILGEADSRNLKRMADYYTEMLELFKLRLIDGVDTNALAVNAAALIGGSVIRHVMGRAAPAPLRLPGIDGELVDWHPAAVGFLAMVDGMTKLADEEAEHE
ncbi:hypothetical protein [Nocardia sp. NPDC051832]|uniref:hypothetical protein n=1 Tax=Nocardia sp. NPDC051832 TaxID=3155673 RepID=UPI003447E1DD